jgi:hypothetical protein
MHINGEAPAVPDEPFDNDINTGILLHLDGDLNDAAGGVTCSLTGSASYSNGNFSSALHAPNPPDGSGALCSGFDLGQSTIEFWLSRPPGSGGGRVISFLGGGGNTGSNKLVVTLNNGTPEVEIWGPSGSLKLTSSIEIPGDNSWHYVHLTYDGNVTAELHIDNSFAGALTTPGVMPGGATTFEVGQGEGIFSCNCSVDEIRISNNVRELGTSSQLNSFLPINLNCYPGMHKKEPNDTAEQANGPLCLPAEILGIPDDNEDYYLFTSSSNGQITIDLFNHPLEGVNGAQLQLFLASDPDTIIAADVVGPYSINHVGNADEYLIRVFTDQSECGPCDTVYMLEVTVP